MEYKISIIIVGKNASLTIKRAIESALNQSFTLPYQVIYIDDHSSDDTLKIAKQYDKIFENKKNIVRPPVSSNIYHSYHLYPLLIDFDKLKINKEIFFKKMFKKGIKLQVHYIPLYIQPYYKKKYNLKPEDFVNSTEFYNKEVSIPIYPGLTKQQIKFISNSILSLTKV